MFLNRETRLRIFSASMWGLLYNVGGTHGLKATCYFQSLYFTTRIENLSFLPNLNLLNKWHLAEICSLRVITGLVETPGRGICLAIQRVLLLIEANGRWIGHLAEL